jgi:alanine racemase
MSLNHGLVINIDRNGFQDNFLTVQNQCPGSEVAAVVKANFYGCGLKQLAPSLIDIGCRTFFVAHLDEAIDLRAQAPFAVIYVLNGLLPGTGDAYRKHNIRPVITSITQAYDWFNFCRHNKWGGSAALHIDTGIHRLGFRLDEISALAALSKSHLAHFDLVLSHLACADKPEDKRNQAQIKSFTWARRLLSAIPKASLASSAGCYLGPEAHFDMVRPGIGLFGGNPFEDRPSPFASILSADATLLQIKLHRAGDFVGYGNDCRLEKDTLVGAMSVGYADGLPRTASAKSLNFYLGGTEIQALGRISMDITLVDLGPVASQAPRIGDKVEIFGKSRCINAFASLIETIPNEIMTSFGRRGQRIYSSDKFSNQQSNRMSA